MPEFLQAPDFFKVAHLTWDFHSITLGCALLCRVIIELLSGRIACQYPSGFVFQTLYEIDTYKFNVLESPQKSNEFKQKKCITWLAEVT